MQGAAYRLGHSRGPHAALYDATSSLGLRTPDELHAHRNDLNTNPDEYITIVPLIARQ